MTLTSEFRPRSSCSAVIVRAGASRMTFCEVKLMMMPFSSPRSTSFSGGCFSSIPSISPRPRTSCTLSLIAGSLRSRAIACSPERGRVRQQPVALDHVENRSRHRHADRIAPQRAAVLARHQQFGDSPAWRTSRRPATRRRWLCQASGYPAQRRCHRTIENVGSRTIAPCARSRSTLRRRSASARARRTAAGLWPRNPADTD